MSTAKQTSIPRSWIPPSFSWSFSPELFALEVEHTAPEVVWFVVIGSCDIEMLPAVKKVSDFFAASTWRESLVDQLKAAVWDPKLLKPPGVRLRNGDIVRAHCHGLFCLPGSQSVLVLVGRNPPSQPNGWFPESLKTQAAALHSAHLTDIAAFEDSVRRKTEEWKRFSELAPVAMAIAEKFECWWPGPQEPVLCGEALLPHAPKAVLFRAVSTLAVDAAPRLAAVAIESSGWQPSREGSYSGILSIRVGRKTLSLVTWEPYQGLVAYPEVRWAVQRRLPRALRNPRAVQSHRPEFHSGLRSMDETNSVLGVTTDASELLEALDGLHLGERDYRNRVEAVRKDAKGQGFDAIAWFQPYHGWTEETWGIYFDARKLDDLALSLLDDFKSAHVHGSHSLAALLAFGLTYAHELFHARVEAALSWAEINAQQPRHLRYSARVYQALPETPDWLEEALANWSAWNWFNALGVQSLFARMGSNPEGLDRVVKAALDLAPPGYKEWRLGQQPGTWRIFANQLSTGKPEVTTAGICLPLESALTGPLPYDFQPSDIPLRFVGPGVIADRLQSHPATFNVPTKREIEKALKHYEHSLDASGGKGGHQKWTGPDQRAFTLPTSDPVTRLVFKTFLAHVGIDKDTYVRQVRPNL